MWQWAGYISRSTDGAEEFSYDDRVPKEPGDGCRLDASGARPVSSSGGLSTEMMMMMYR